MFGAKTQFVWPLTKTSYSASRYNKYFQYRLVVCIQFMSLILQYYIILVTPDNTQHWQNFICSHFTFIPVWTLHYFAIYFSLQSQITPKNKIPRKGLEMWFVLRSLKKTTIMYNISLCPACWIYPVLCVFDWLPIVLLSQPTKNTINPLSPGDSRQLHLIYI